jgi:hypothetical protein
MSIADLWLPILVSAVIVWIASALIWTVLPWHKSDYAKTGDEEGVRAALKGLAPRFYNVPHVTDMQDLKKAEVGQKFTDGPVAFITVLPNGMPNMARNMVLQIVYFVFVGILCAYFVSRTTGPDADYLEVFRIVVRTALVEYGQNNDGRAYLRIADRRRVRLACLRRGALKTLILACLYAI